MWPFKKRRKKLDAQAEAFVFEVAQRVDDGYKKFLEPFIQILADDGVSVEAITALAQSKTTKNHYMLAVCIEQAGAAKNLVGPIKGIALEDAIIVFLCQQNFSTKIRRGEMERQLEHLRDQMRRSPIESRFITACFILDHEDLLTPNLHDKLAEPLTRLIINATIMEDNTGSAMKSFLERTQI